MGSPIVSRGRRSRRSLSEINVVPYIDVTLVLLIIFMVTAPMIVTGAIDLPRANQTLMSKSSVQATIEVRLLKDGTFQIVDRSTGQITDVKSKGDLLEIGRTIAKEADTPMIIIANRDTSYDHVLEVLSILKDEAGVKRVGLLVQKR